MLDFSNSSLYSDPAPTEESIELERQRILHEKTAQLTSYHVKIFDMSKDDDRQEYEKLMPELFSRVSAKTCVVWAKDRQLINGTWKIYLEWSDYSIGKQGK